MGSSKTSVDEFNKSNESLITVLEKQVIPGWERFSLNRLAVTAKNLKQFQKQALPELMRTSVKKRVGKKVISRSRRYYNNANTFSASWPEDDQAVYRYPALVFILQGQADFQVGDYVVHCPQGHFLLFGTGVSRPLGNRSHIEGDNPEQRHCVVLWFFAPPGTRSVTAYLCHSQGKKHWKNTDLDFCVVHRTEVLDFFNLAVREMEEGDGQNRKIVASSFQAFLHLFLRELEQGRFHRSGSSSNAEIVESEISPIAQAQRYVKTHLNHSLTTANVAEGVHMSRNSFVRHFTRETGQTFHEFVIQERMEEARRLLSEGYWSTEFICRFIGLKPTQFRMQFKKHFGIAPSQFSQQQKRKVQKR